MRNNVYLMVVVFLALTPQTVSMSATTPLDTSRFIFQFSSDGHPASFKTHMEGQELLLTSDPGLGFYLMSRDNVPLRFDHVRIENGTLVASCGDGLPRVTMTMHQSESYLAFRVERLEGIPASPEYSMHFEMKLTQPVRAFELDYMTEARGGNEVKVDWRHLWNRDPENPKGGFALYQPKDEADEDETILRIWVNEGLPHPRVEGNWDLAAARAWVDQWLAEYNDQSRFYISARTPEELYAAVPYAEKAGVREVYLFTDTWRGGDLEPFWTSRQLNWGINTAVFPRGEEDLRAFSEHLRARDMHLKLHWVSGGIGLRDPKYVGNAPDPRLASWGRGTLAADVGPADRTIQFRPEPGVSAPFRLPAGDFGRRYTYPPALHREYDYEFMVVGDELIRVGAFEDTDQDVWRLMDCQRGAGATRRAAHETGEAVRGLISAYGQQLLPENDSSLLEEMARNYAEMLNRCGIANVEYDGLELHAYNGRSWGAFKFASLVYSHLDHPVTAGSSGGNAPPAHMEYRLNATRNAGRGRHKGNVPILLDQPFRPASHVLDVHWGMSQTCAHGFTMYNILKPEPLFGINIDTLRGHGQTGQILETASNWKRVNQIISPEQREQMRKTMFHEEDLLGQAGHHEQSALVHVLTRGVAQWEIHPTQVLTRPGSEDVRWQDGQEHGAISPRQFVKPGESLQLVNPFVAQAPRVILRVLWGFDSSDRTETAHVGGGTDERGADSAFDYARMASSRAGTKGAAGNVLLQPAPGEMRNPGDTRIEGKDTTLTLEAGNPFDHPLVNEDNLPEWSRTINMTARRGVGMWVTGDGSGAVLVFQIPGGDYVVPLTFMDRRYIEIPNAQAAWADGAWGWRMGSKRSHYERVQFLNLGFGYIPPRSNVRGAVEGLTALQEIPTELHNPVMHAGDAKLEVQGAVASGQYLTWEGGPTATVYDSNWNHMGNLPVIADGFLIPTGEFECRITSDEEGTLPWLEIQLMTRDIPIVISDPTL